MSGIIGGELRPEEVTRIFKEINGRKMRIEGLKRCRQLYRAYRDPQEWPLWQEILDAAIEEQYRNPTQVGEELETT